MPFPEFNLIYSRFENSIEPKPQEKILKIDHSCKAATDLIGKIVQRCAPCVSSNGKEDFSFDTSHPLKIQAVKEKKITAISKRDVLKKESIFLEQAWNDKHWQEVNLQHHPKFFFKNQCCSFSNTEQKKCKESVSRIFKHFSNHSGTINKELSLTSRYPLKELEIACLTKAQDSKKCQQDVSKLMFFLGNVKIEDNT